MIEEILQFVKPQGPQSTRFKQLNNIQNVKLIPHKTTQYAWHRSTNFVFS